MLMAVRGSGHSHIGGQVCPRPSPREDAQWLYCPRTRAAGNTPVPEEAGEIILISLCHLGTKGDRGDKKEGGTQHMGRGSQGVPWWGLPRERCQAPRSLSGDLRQRCANPGGRVATCSQISGLHLNVVHWVSVAFTVPHWHRKVRMPLAWWWPAQEPANPSPEGFADRAGLRGPSTLFFVEAAAFLLGQM